MIDNQGRWTALRPQFSFPSAAWWSATSLAKFRTKPIHNVNTSCPGRLAGALRLTAQFSLCGCRTEVSTLLRLVDLGLLPAPEAEHTPGRLTLSVFTASDGAFLLHQIPLTLKSHICLMAHLIKPPAPYNKPHHLWNVPPHPQVPSKRRGFYHWLTSGSC